MTHAMTVVKLGGTQGVDFSAICADAAEMLKNGHRLVLVHGGSAEANALGEALGMPPKFITSPSGYTSRYTDRNTLEIFLMAVNGKVNSLLVEQLHMLGINAFGLSGMDGQPAAGHAQGCHPEHAKMASARSSATTLPARSSGSMPMC